MGGCIRIARHLTRSGKLKGSEQPQVRRPQLSTDLHGPNANISQRVLSGRGAVLGTLDITQDDGYLEIVVRAEGYFEVGITPMPKDPSKDLNRKVCDNKTSFGLTSDMLAAVPRPGDVIGVYFERENGFIRLSFTLNGLPLGDMYDIPKPGSNTKITGDEHYYPVFYVAKGAMIEVNMCEDQWKYSPYEDPFPNERSPATTSPVRARLKAG
jgi:hypothetical protein